MTKPIRNRPLQKPGPPDRYTTILAVRVPTTAEMDAAVRVRCRAEDIAIVEAIRRALAAWLEQ